MSSNDVPKEVEPLLLRQRMVDMLLGHRDAHHSWKRNAFAYGAVIALVAAIVFAQIRHGGMYRDYLVYLSYLLIALSGALAIPAAFSRHKSYEFSVLCTASVIVFFAVTTLLGQLWDRPHLALQYQMLIASGLLIYLICSGSALGVRHVFVIVGALAVLGTLQAVFGILQVLFDVKWLPRGWESLVLENWYAWRAENASLIRMRGLFLNPNQLAFFLNIVDIILICINSFADIKPRYRIWILFCVVWCVIGSLLTLSRGGLLSLLVSAGVILFLNLMVIFNVQKCLQRSFLVVNTVVLVMVFLFSVWAVIEHEPFISRVENFFQEQFRQTVWDASLKQINSSPLIGTGPFTFQYYVRQLTERPLRFDPIFAHNDWLQITAEFGILAGQLALVVVILHLVIAAVRLLGAVFSKEGRFDKVFANAFAIRLAGFVAVIYIAIHSAFDFNLQVPANMFVAAICFGLINRGMHSRSRLGGFLKYGFVATTAFVSFFILVNVIPRWGEAKAILQADNHVLRNDDLQALWVSREALRNSNHPLLHRLAGESLVRLSRDYRRLEGRSPNLRAAVLHFDEAIQRDGLEYSHYVWRGIAHGMLVEFDAAAEDLDHAMVLDPFNPQPYEFRGWLLEMQGKREEAVAMYRHAARLPNARLARIRLRLLE